MATKLRRTASAWIRPLHRLWKFLSWIWVAIVISGLVNIASSWLTTNAPLGWILSHLEIILPLIGAFLVLTGLACLASVQDEKQTGAHPILLSPSQKHYERVLQCLRRSYVTLLEDSLQRATWLELGLLEKQDAVQNAATLLVRAISLPERQLPPGTSIVQVYQDANQELLILGEPGSGKSTLLYALAQYLVNQAETNKADPLPIVLPLSDWSRHRLPLQLWIGEQLTQIYQIPKSIALQWLQDGHVLPLLDGLDEMEETARPACIQAINVYHRDYLNSLVVCSRTAEYTTASTTESLALQTAVVIQPLSAAQVEAVLIQGGGALTALRRAYQTNPSLQELATKPLMLNLLILTYQGVEIEDLPTNERALQQQLFTHYVKRMVERKGNIALYPLQQTQTFLSRLAFCMRESHFPIFMSKLKTLSIFDDLLDQKGKQWEHWGCRGILGILFGLIGGLIGWWLAGLIGGSIGLIVGLINGLTEGWIIFIFIIIGCKLINLLLNRKVDFGDNMPFRSLSGGLFNGLLGGLIVWLRFGLFKGLISGLLFGLFFGLFPYLRYLIQPYILSFALWRSHLPWNLADFLDDARARHLLRRDGDVYYFIHLLLQDYFADLKDDR